MLCLLYDPQRVAAAMDEAGLEALVATSAANVQYLTRFRRGDGALAVLARGDLERPQLVVKASSISFALEDPCDQVGVHVHGNFIRYVADGVELTGREGRLLELHNAARHDADPWTLAAEILAAAGLQRGVVGVDSGLEGAAKLSAALPALELKSVPDLFRRLRMVKTPEEVSRLAEAARVTEHAILTSVQSAFLGATQRGLARVFNHTAIEANCFIRQDNVSIGRSTVFGNLNTPTDVVADGDIIRYDVGVHYEGYASDIARCYAFRKAHARAARIQDALVEGERALLDAIRPGVTAAQLFDVAVRAVRKAGIEPYDRTHVGHGVGIAGAGYDPPLLAAADNTPLEPGMVLCIETPYVEIGFGALQVEDTIVVTEDGYRLLTNSARHLRVVP